MDLKELGELVGWSEKQVEKALDSACRMTNSRPSEGIHSYHDEPFLEWLAELVAEVDRPLEKRKVIHKMAETYFYTGGDVAQARAAAEEVDAALEPFAAVDLIRIGSIHDASRAALRKLNVGAAAELLRMEVGNPYYEKGKPRHISAQNMHIHLDGTLGLRVAARTKEHLELCKGCAENYQYALEHPKENYPEDEQEA